MALNAHDKIHMEVIHRSKLKFATYNPRLIEDNNRRKLKKNIKDVGLITPIIWNKRTGNIVSGHQRLAILDSLQKSEDYELNVAVVDFDEQTEKVQNIFMNNADTQGMFDFDKLSPLLKELNTSDTGFELADEYQTLGGDFDQMDGDKIAEVADKLREMEKAEPARRVKVKDNPNFFLVVPFRSYEERKAFTDKMGWPDNRYVSGEMLAEALKK